MSKEKNFSAFPCAAFGPTENDFIHQRGMTMRDWFAGMAMQGILAYSHCGVNGNWNENSSHEARAKFCYEQADAMMARIEEGKK